MSEYEDGTRLLACMRGDETHELAQIEGSSVQRCGECDHKVLVSPAGTVMVATVETTILCTDCIADNVDLHDMPAELVPGGEKDVVTKMGGVEEATRYIKAVEHLKIGDVIGLLNRERS